MIYIPDNEYFYSRYQSEQDYAEELHESCNEKIKELSESLDDIRELVSGEISVIIDLLENCIGNVEMIVKVKIAIDRLNELIEKMEE